ncbi:hypothetical protein AURDEDRAFT_167724 [Auricularia subglabra TFB-10046 SS5]|nr:hypothetical protein AURDEDRAFT_167724 [Auricularia subglabra TFB-10046 SS5]
MSFIDFPARRDRTRLGTVIAFALDPAASLAALNDRVVEDAAGRMAMRKRLAIVDDPLALIPGVARHTFYPIGRGLPSDAWASVPILPASSHPDGREPVSVSGALPFGDAYVHTTHTFDGAVSRLYTSAPSGIHLSAAQTAAVFSAHSRDTMRLQFGDNWEDDDAVFRGSDLGQPLTPTFTDPHYQIWVHVLDNEDFADPSTLEAELEQLYAIEAEWRRRRTAEVEAKAHLLIQWRQTLADQAWEDDPEDGVAVVGPDDDGLSDEDGIDEPSSAKFDEDGEASGERLTHMHETPADWENWHAGIYGSEPACSRRDALSLGDEIENTLAAKHTPTGSVPDAQTKTE